MTTWGLLSAKATALTSMECAATFFTACPPAHAHQEPAHALEHMGKAAMLLGAQGAGQQSMA